ncbi:recombinase family protein [Phototrophicus methaneseepsis]|uniref:Recombinase family protein n=2 Tax=Phototrophicus methaneseepsis TaxID=2710758 RepID=A0A7S8E7D2_9CHLR|nr:recombinase family protein [Phototrophicus methaneseepsis]
MSQDRQRFNINRALLERSDLVVVDEYTDTMSGRTPKRAGYQRLLDDARSGCFSHVAVENAERFGRNDTEALIAIDELHEHGIVVRFADYPDLDPIDADDRLLITISFTLARRESLKLGERVRGGLYAKLRNGGYTTRAPDGYLNVERKADTPASSKMGRYERWIETDPQQFKVWRLVWNLLLTDKHSLAEICEHLHLRGFRYRTGRPFIEIKNDRRKPAVNTLSKIFHNWFYAGWVVSEKASIPPKTVKGHWKPVVTTEEFERGLEILSYRSRHRIAKRRHFYLLKELVYLHNEDTGNLTKLTGSTSNSSRKSGGTAYYCVWSSNINIKCEIIDDQIAQLIKQIHINPDQTLAIQDAYTKEVAEKLGHLRPSEEKQLEDALKAISEEETRTARLYAIGKITDEVWDLLWQEWQDKRRSIQTSLVSLNRQHEAHIADLDAALTIISKVSILYSNLGRDDQRSVLHEMVDKIVVNRFGTVVNMVLLPPFSYLKHISDQVKAEEMQAVVDGNEKSSRSATASQCSEYISVSR